VRGFARATIPAAFRSVLDRARIDAAKAAIRYERPLAPAEHPPYPDYIPLADRVAYYLGHDTIEAGASKHAIVDYDGVRAATPTYRYALDEVRGFARVTIPAAYRFVLDRVRQGIRASICGYRDFLDWMRGVVRVTIPLTYHYVLDRGRWSVRVLVPLAYPYFTIAIIALAALIPLSLVLYQSLLIAPFSESSPRLALSAYRFVFADNDFHIAFRTTLMLAAGIMLIAVPLGTAVAFVIVRTDIPGRHWIDPLILLPIFLPTLVLAFGVAFWLLALNQMLIALVRQPEVNEVWFNLLGVAAFLLIAAAIVLKNARDTGDV
jgi:hypothetical protein